MICPKCKTATQFAYESEVSSMVIEKQYRCKCGQTRESQRFRKNREDIENVSDFDKDWYDRVNGIV
ncbi:hypothetical protein EON83_20340 [bacterium]|nr:MAG: hypothetical protein EON83_20340 [bacterium]